MVDVPQNHHDLGLVADNRWDLCLVILDEGTAFPYVFNDGLYADGGYRVLALVEENAEECRYLGTLNEIGRLIGRVVESRRRDPTLIQKSLSIRLKA